MVVLRSLIFTSVLFLVCWFTLPSHVYGGKNKHGGSSGIDTLLTAGVLAKVLQNNGGGGGGGGGGRSAVPIGGHHQEYRHGAPTMHYPSPDGRAAMPYAPQPMMTYGQPVQYAPQPMMHYGQPMQYAPQQMMPYVHQPQAQAPYGHFQSFQPTDRMEVISV